MKDAALMARTDDPVLRRAWRTRLVDQDGDAGDPGGLVRWLALAEALGLDPAAVRAGAGVLPATRFAVDAYVRFVGEASLVAAVASSLTELFAPALIAERMRDMLAHYAFLRPAALEYFATRLDRVPRDAAFGLAWVLEHARTAEAQADVLRALRFECDVLWALLDALHHAYVLPAHVPPGAFRPAAPPAAPEEA
jgi:pyrroloquinoline-quinone synthase